MPATGSNDPRVVIVDADEETRLVLGELLARAGAATETHAAAACACEAIDRGGVAALVVDLDSLSGHEASVLMGHARRENAAIVALGTNRPAGASEDDTFVRKPYHYREVVRKIRMSLGYTAPGTRAAA